MVPASCCWEVRVPRAGQVKPPVEPRLSDRIAIGVLTSTYPPELVDRVVAESGRTQQRQRLLPARVVVWLVLAMALFSGQAYEEVARLLAGGLGWARRWQQWFRVPSTPAIAKARARLGAEPLRRLFVEVARPLATPDTKGAWYRGFRVLAVDGTTLDVADTPANAAAFGRPATHRGEQTAFPQVRVVAVAECGTHAIIAAAMGPLARGETTLAAGLLGPDGVLGAGTLLLADRLFVDANLWRQAAGTGADLVWRTKTNAVLPVLDLLGDGSYLSQIAAATDRRHGIAPTVVRVVEYTLGKDPGRPARPAPIRLLTTITDPTLAPAAELAALYHQRWEFETALDELKTHQRGPKVVLRSKTPEMVAQEVWGMLLVHLAIRRLMHQAALDAGVDPDRVSFIRSLRIVRRQVSATGQAAIPP
jgi:Insertion element 4 transposase N-terminal/Transposase DDE domain